MHLPIELWDDLSDSLGCSSGGGDDILSCCAASTPVLSKHKAVLSYKSRPLCLTSPNCDHEARCFLSVIFFSEVSKLLWLKAAAAALPYVKRLGKEVYVTSYWICSLKPAHATP